MQHLEAMRLCFLNKIVIIVNLLDTDTMFAIKFDENK